MYTASLNLTFSKTKSNPKIVSKTTSRRKTKNAKKKKTKKKILKQCDSSVKTNARLNNDSFYCYIFFYFAFAKSANFFQKKDLID